MSGGGTRVTRGKMCLGSAAPVVVDPATSRAELVTAEERVQKLEAELEEHRHAAAENAARADDAVKAQETAAMDFQKSCLAVQSGTRKCKELKLQLQELDAYMTVWFHTMPSGTVNLICSTRWMHMTWCMTKTWCSYLLFAEGRCRS